MAYSFLEVSRWAAPAPSSGSIATLLRGLQRYAEELHANIGVSPKMIESEALGKLQAGCAQYEDLIGFLGWLEGESATGEEIARAKATVNRVCSQLTARTISFSDACRNIREAEEEIFFNSTIQENERITTQAGSLEAYALGIFQQYPNKLRAMISQGALSYIKAGHLLFIAVEKFTLLQKTFRQIDALNISEADTLEADVYRALKAIAKIVCDKVFDDTEEQQVSEDRIISMRLSRPIQLVSVGKRTEDIAKGIYANFCALQPYLKNIDQLSSVRPDIFKALRRQISEMYQQISEANWLQIREAIEKKSAAFSALHQELIAVDRTLSHFEYCT
jgi:hypothetical protein